MKFKYNYHRDLSTLHIGCEKPRSYFIPYESAKAADEGVRGKSSRFVNLCGDWNFRYYPSINNVDDFTASDFDTSAMETMTVPRSWQTVLGRGYDVPNYTNVNYPYPVDPPHLPNDIPCALYTKRFHANANWLTERNVFINFEGVDSCFYLFVNNKFVAYSQVSHMTSEIDITPYITPGMNELKVLVLKWCDGSYLEDQDKYRLSGIFREVYLLLRDKTHVKDIYSKAELNQDYSQGVVSVEMLLNGASAVEYRLTAPDGSEVACGSVEIDTNGKFQMSVSNPELWSDELPNLYKLHIKCGEEYMCLQCGFRHILVKNKVVYINGQKVKARGVNRHDSHPILGYATPYDHMLRDIFIMKAHNVNMIRTSHYPNDPRLYEMCNKYGLYVCNEADIEAHGMRRIGNWDALTDNPDWTEAYLDRAERMFERDKNHPCIIMWSVGNESGIGRNHRAMANYFHERMPGCIVHSEDISCRLHANLTAEDKSLRTQVECDYIDIESRMYPSPDECLHDYLNNKSYSKPLFLCEYSHAMGNGPGCLGEYWDMILSHDSFFGGCVWEFTDHSVAIGDNIYADPHYTYGGDFGDKPNDINFCVDGLVYPDRRPHTGLLEYKQAIKPFAIEGFDVKTGYISIRNLRFFKDLSDLDMYWKLVKNGQTIAQGRLTELKVPAQKVRRLKLCTATPDQDLTLDISLRQNISYPWADAGYEVGSHQVVISENTATQAITTACNATLAVAENDTEIVIKTAKTTYTVDRIAGLISSIKDQGREMLTTPITPTVWRAPTDNDRKIKPSWYSAGYDRTNVKCYSCDVTASDASSTTVCAKLSLGGHTFAPILHINTIYTFYANGGVKFDMDVCVRDNLPELPRFGVQFNMPEGTENINYFGRGPVESYIDKRLASKLGEYASTVTDHFEPYVRPQENMAHADTRWCAVTSLTGHGLLAVRTEKPFSFNCAHFTPAQLTTTLHDYELKPLKDTVVNIDYRHAGIGSNSCGPVLKDCWKLNEKQFNFSFRLLPVFIADTDPYAEIGKI